MQWLNKENESKTLAMKIKNKNKIQQLFLRAQQPGDWPRVAMVRVGGGIKLLIQYIDILAISLDILKVIIKGVNLLFFFVFLFVGYLLR